MNVATNVISTYMLEIAMERCDIRPVGRTDSARSGRGMIVAAVVLGLVAIVDAHAEVPDWVLDAISESEAPEEVYYLSFAASDCPFADDQLDAIIERKLTTSRLQPKRWATWIGVYDELLVLAIHVGCLGRQTGNPVFDLDVHFAVYFQTAGQFAGASLVDWQFGSFGIGGRDYILRAVDDAVEDAISAYVQANF